MYVILYIRFKIGKINKASKTIYIQILKQLILTIDTIVVTTLLVRPVLTVNETIRNGLINTYWKRRNSGIRVRCGKQRITPAGWS